MGFRTRNRERAEGKRKFPNESKAAFTERAAASTPLKKKRFKRA